MKPSRVLCSMFLLAILGVDFARHKTWQNTNGGYMCSYN